MLTVSQESLLSWSESLTLSVWAHRSTRSSYIAAKYCCWLCSGDKMCSQLALGCLYLIEVCVSCYRSYLLRLWDFILIKQICKLIQKCLMYLTVAFYTYQAKYVFVLKYDISSWLPWFSVLGVAGVCRSGLWRPPLYLILLCQPLASSDGAAASQSAGIPSAVWI